MEQSTAALVRIIALAGFSSSCRKSGTTALLPAINEMAGFDLAGERLAARRDERDTGSQAFAGARIGIGGWGLKTSRYPPLDRSDYVPSNTSLDMTFSMDLGTIEEIMAEYYRKNPNAAEFRDFIRSLK